MIKVDYLTKIRCLCIGFIGIVCNTCSDAPLRAKLMSDSETLSPQTSNAVPVERLKMELAFMALPIESLQIRQMGESFELYFQKNHSHPYCGLAYENHDNGQVKLLFSINKGKVFSAKGWRINGEPNETYIKSGSGFVIETDNPEVGFIYEGGIQAGYKGLTDNGKTFRQSFIDGENILYHANGKKWEQGRHENGVRVGVWREWNIDGVLVKERNYSSGYYDGVCREWYDDGTNRSILHFCNGKLEGMWTEYDEEGHLTDIMEFSNGLAEGLWKSFHDNGQLKFEGTFCNDLEDGWHIWRDRFGRITKRKFFAKGREVH